MAVVLLAEAGARVLDPHLPPMLDWPSRDYIQHQDGLAGRAGRLDLLVLGSSTAGRALPPDHIERAQGIDEPSGYNYWLAGAPMRSIDLLMTDVLEPKVTPSTVVIGVTMREFASSPSQAAHVEALRSAYGFQVATGRRGVIDTMDHHLQSVSALARHRVAFRDPPTLERELGSPSLVPERVGPDGFLLDRGQNQLVDEPPAHLAQERAVMANYVVSPDDVIALAHLLGRLHDRGTRALVVNLPVTDEFIDMADDRRADYQEYYSEVQSTTVDNHALWLDAMAQAWPDRYFGDVDHLNDSGAAELLPLVVAALVRPVGD